MELIMVVLTLSILACVAVPRFNLGAVWGAKTDALARQIATDLRRTRAQAIQNAAQNPTGYALVIAGSAYQIVGLHDSTVVATCEIPPEVQCAGGVRFEFGPLGNLREGSDTELRVSTEGKTYTIEIVPATGAVKCTQTAP
jgi:hypothetical protein